MFSESVKRSRVAVLFPRVRRAMETVAGENSSAMPAESSQNNRAPLSVDSSVHSSIQRTESYFRHSVFCRSATVLRMICGICRCVGRDRSQSIGNFRYRNSCASVFAVEFCGCDCLRPRRSPCCPASVTAAVGQGDICRWLSAISASVSAGFVSHGHLHFLHTRKGWS